MQNQIQDLKAPKPDKVSPLINYRALSPYCASVFRIFNGARYLRYCNLVLCLHCFSLSTMNLWNQCSFIFPEYKYYYAVHPHLWDWTLFTQNTALPVLVHVTMMRFFYNHWAISLLVDCLFPKGITSQEASTLVLIWIIIDMAIIIYWIIEIQMIFYVKKIDYLSWGV